MVQLQKTENGGFYSSVPRTIAHKPPPLARICGVVVAT